MAPEVVVHNVCARFNLHCRLDLKQMSRKLFNVEYKYGLSELTMRLKSPRCTCKVAASGKASLFGARTEEEAKQAARRFARIVQNQGNKVKFGCFKIVNVMATVRMPFNIDILELVKDYKNICSCEPELHQSCNIRLEKIKVTVQIFYTGNICLLGRSVAGVHEAAEFAHNLVLSFQKKRTPAEALPTASKQGKRRSEDGDDFIVVDDDEESVDGDVTEEEFSDESKDTSESEDETDQGDQIQQCVKKRRNSKKQVRKRKFSRCTGSGESEDGSDDDNDDHDYIP